MNYDENSKKVNRQKRLHRDIWNIYSVKFIKENWFNICIMFVGLSVFTNPIESNLDNRAAASVMFVIVLVLNAVNYVQNREKKWSLIALSSSL